MTEPHRKNETPGDAENRCPQCARPLPSGAPSGLCPACLLRCGLQTNTRGFTAEDAPAAGWTPPEPAEIAGLFPELEIIELIGRGGMGAVYKARQKELDRVVALKILPPEIGRDLDLAESFAQRFAREARAMAKLNHPNIVTIHDFGRRAGAGDEGDGEDRENGGIYFFVMEYIDGLSLRQLLDRGPVKPDEALAIVPQICDALQYAHDRGIVHRDIKPENILLNRAGEVKIADFGLARLMGLAAPPGAAAHDTEAGGSRGAPGPSASEPDVTAADGRVCGTPKYMAPEQTERPREVDHRADIYSLGVVFYQMLTGELPAGRADEAFEPPSRKVLIDVRLDEVVLRALEREPARRYQQVSQIRTQVETIVGSPTGEPVQATSRAIASPSRGEVRFSRLAIVGAAWAPFAFVAFVLQFSGRAVAAGQHQGPNLPQVLMVVFLGGLGLTAPFGTTICGVVSLLHIRRSRGKLHGLGLALADILLFPLLALGALFAWALMALFHVLVRPDPTFGPGEYMAYKQGWYAMSVVVCLVVDFFIVRWAWRAAKRPVGQTADQPESPSSPRHRPSWHRWVAVVGIRAGRPMVNWPGIIVVASMLFGIMFVAFSVVRWLMGGNLNMWAVLLPALLAICTLLPAIYLGLTGRISPEKLVPVDGPIWPRWSGALCAAGLVWLVAWSISLLTHGTDTVSIGPVKVLFGRLTVDVSVLHAVAQVGLALIGICALLISVYVVSDNGNPGGLNQVTDSAAD